MCSTFTDIPEIWYPGRVCPGRTLVSRTSVPDILRTIRSRIFQEMMNFTKILKFLKKLTITNLILFFVVWETVLKVFRNLSNIYRIKVAVYRRLGKSLEISEALRMWRSRDGVRFDYKSLWTFPIDVCLAVDSFPPEGFHPIVPTRDIALRIVFCLCQRNMLNQFLLTLSITNIYYYYWYIKSAHTCKIPDESLHRTCIYADLWPPETVT